MTVRADARQRLLTRVRQESRGWETPCLIWLGEKDKYGFGLIKDRGHYRLAHHILIDQEKLKEFDKVTHHKCGQHDCVRPSHIEFVSRPKMRIARMKVYDRDKGICHICKRPVDPKDWHLDHVVPLAAGGTHTYDNIRVSHPFCNLSKNDEVER